MSNKRGRPRGQQEVSPTEAKNYGINVPIVNDSADQFLSPNDIGKILNVTGEAVKQWIYRRKLPAVKLANGYWKVKKADFEGFLKQRTEIGKRHIMVFAFQIPEIQTSVTGAVEALGYTSVAPHNPADALLKALDHFPAMFIVVVSHAIVEGPGWAFIRTVRSNKSLRSFPILLITGDQLSEPALEKAVEFEVQGTLVFKTSAMDVLKKEIERILRRTM